MKNLIFINGTMGAGKSSVCAELLKMLPNAVYLDATGAGICIRLS